MSLLHAIDWLYALSGFVVGLLVGMTGVGGGALMTPILVLLFGVHPATAVGTDLLYAAATKSAGTLMHGITRNIEWRVVALLAAGSVPMTIVTLVLLGHFRLGRGAAELISLVLGLALLATAAALVLRAPLLRFVARRRDEPSARRTATLTVLTGAALGVLVSVSSVGAGALGVTALILLYPRLPTARIVGSDIAHAVPLTLVAGIGHFLIGSIDVPILFSLLIGSLPGIVLGSSIARRVPDTVLRLTLAAVLAVVGARLVF